MTELRPFPFAQGPNVCPSREHAEIRAAGEPVRVRLADGRTALVVADYADVRTVLTDPRFSREAAATGNPFFARTRQSLALSGSDAPDHTRRRKAISHAFSPARVAGLVPWLEALADELVEAMTAQGREGDLVCSFTIPFTMRPMCRLIGIPEDDCALLKPWVDAMMSINRFPAQQVAEAHKHMSDYFAALVAAQRDALTARTPAQGLLTDLLRASGTGQGLSTDEIEVMGAGLLMAGYETISNHLAASLYVLLERPALAERIRQDGTALPSVIEELLRHISLAGTGGHKHQALEDVPLTRTVVRAGELVVPLTEAANHDPAVFDDADAFRPDRSPNPHIAFGAGRHFCPGAALARAELEVALRRLLTRLPGLELAGPAERVAWRQDMYIGGPWSLPVRWT
ncbi:cytochrome P450 [Streptomyces sp. 4N124]|uniref:cytochrome P450 n=1 Tax=Streptomyces sp. 4N124 TaxID=3457420 RepID=UPI003FD6BDB2